MRTHRRFTDPPTIRIALLCVAALVFIYMSACERSSRDAEVFTSAGVTHLQMGEHDRAIRNFDRALSLHPGLVVAWRNRALAHREKGDYERAIADYEHASVLAPSDERIFTDRGVTYVLLGDYRQALRDFDRAIALKPDHAPALEHRGRTHFFLGNFAQAAADLQRGRSVDSTDAYAVLWLHLARQRLRQDDHDDFASHATVVDTTAWPAPIVRHLLGRIDTDSLKSLAAAAEIKGRRQSCVAAFYVGQQELLRGDLGSATASFEETRAGCPKESSEYKGAAAELQRLATSDGASAP
jgi:lipoprotein NlpI